MRLIIENSPPSHSHNATRSRTDAEGCNDRLWHLTSKSDVRSNVGYWGDKRNGCKRPWSDAHDPSEDLKPTSCAKARPKPELSRPTSRHSASLRQVHRAPQARIALP